MQYHHKTKTNNIRNRKKQLKEGQNNFEIKVTAEDGKTTKTYKLTVTREKQIHQLEKKQQEKKRQKTLWKVMM